MRFAIATRSIRAASFCLAAALALLQLCFAQPCAAQTPTTDTPSPAARERFEQGVAAYEAGRFGDAVQAFQEADRLAPSARLSFNIAKAYERMADDRRALAAYQDYLRRAPEATNRAEVEQIIERLERELQPATLAAREPSSTPPASSVLALAPAEPTVPLSAPPPTPELTRGPRWWTWTLFGAAAVSLSASGAFELSRAQQDHQARSSQVQLEHQQSFEAMQSSQTAARVFLGVGAAAALAGGVSLYFDLKAREHSPDAVALGCDAEGCRMHAGGMF